MYAFYRFCDKGTEKSYLYTAAVAVKPVKLSEKNLFSSQIILVPTKAKMVYFHTKNPNLGIFGEPWNGHFLYILCQYGIFYCHLVYFMAMRYILWPCGIFYGHLVHIFCGHLVLFFRLCTKMYPCMYVTL
jgi:hypothetical protein